MHVSELNTGYLQIFLTLENVVLYDISIYITKTTVAQYNIFFYRALLLKYMYIVFLTFSALKGLYISGV